MGKRNIGKIQIKRFYKKEIFEEEKTEISYEILALENKFFIEFKDSIPFVKNDAKNIYVDSIIKGEHRSVKAEIFFNFPGIFYFHKILYTSSYPLPFLQFKKSFPLEGSIVVYPKYFDLSYFPEHLMNIQSESEQFKSHVGYGDDIWGIKQYEFGDRIRDIDWKLSLKLDDILVKVREKKIGKKLWVLPLIKDHVYSQGNSNIIRMTASIIKNRIDNEYAVGEIIGDKIIIPQMGREHIYLLLKELANIWNVYGSNKDQDLFMESYLNNSIAFIITNSAPKKNIPLIHDLKKYGNTVIFIYINDKIQNKKELKQLALSNGFFIYMTDDNNMGTVFED